MEYGTIERELKIEATPEIVFEVVSSPEHIMQWWGAETDLEPVPGSTGALTWRNARTGSVKIVSITVVDVRPPRLFSFRWTHGSDEVAESANSLLVTFELVASGGGTLLRFTETGFRERGWELAKLEEAYREHAASWDTFLPRISECASRKLSSRQ